LIANKDERAGRAEEVSGDEQCEDEPSAVLHPGQNGREIRRRNLGTEEAVQDEMIDFFALTSCSLL
jgi:hypothetical protein